MQDPRALGIIHKNECAFQVKITSYIHPSYGFFAAF